MANRTGVSQPVHSSDMTNSTPLSRGWIWKARSTSVQVLRATYRLNGPMKNGLAIGAVVLNQNWHLQSEASGGDTRFRPVSAGITAGYYLHFGKHFYMYPTTAFTYNSVVSGKASVQGTPYKVAKFGPNASLHAGWEWTPSRGAR